MIIIIILGIIFGLLPTVLLMFIIKSGTTEFLDKEKKLKENGKSSYENRF